MGIRTGFGDALRRRRLAGSGTGGGRGPGHRELIATRRLVADAAYSNLCPDPGGRYLYALRSAIDAPPAPVRLDVTQADQQPQYLPSPAPAPTLPGTLSELSVVRDGMSVRAWLCLPSGTDAPAEHSRH